MYKFRINFHIKTTEERLKPQKQKKSLMRNTYTPLPLHTKWYALKTSWKQEISTALIPRREGE